MRGQTIPNQDDLLAAKLSSQLDKELNQLLVGEAPRDHTKVQPTLLPIPAVADGAADGKLFPIERIAYNGRLASGCPCASDRGFLRNAAFIKENYPCAEVFGVFFTLIQVLVFHCCTAASSQGGSK
ncbi:MAG: hypothetical protein ABSG38_02145 [Spirochaetia bacterium]